MRWWAEAELATSRSRRLPTILNLYEWAEKKRFVSLKLDNPSGVRTRDLWLSSRPLWPGPPSVGARWTGHRGTGQRRDESHAYCSIEFHPAVLTPTHAYSAVIKWFHLPDIVCGGHDGIGCTLGVIESLAGVAPSLYTWGSLDISASFTVIFTANDKSIVVMSSGMAGSLASRGGVGKTTYW